MVRHPIPVLVLSLLLPLAARAAGVPLTLSTSGYLLDAADHPLTQPGVSLGFSVWTDVASPANESRVWPATGESTCVVSATNGFYAAVLDGSQATGCGAGLTSAHLPGTAPRYLQVSVGGVTLSPRLRVGTVPTAALAAHSADTQALVAGLAQGGASVNAAGNLVDWKALGGVPEGLADGIDSDTTYTAAASGGLSLLGNAFSIPNGGVTNAMLAQSSVTVTAGAGLSGGGAVALGGATTLSLANVPSVTPGSYTNANLTVDAQGRLTAASNGSAAGGTVVSVGAGAGLSGGPITASGSLAIASDGVTNTMLASDAASLAKVTGATMAVVDGNVGVGTTSPAAKLEVAGGIRIGTTSACGATTGGTLRWTGAALQVCDGNGWLNVTATAADPFTRLLLHMDGSGTSFVDSSNTSFVVTPVGAATQNATAGNPTGSAGFATAASFANAGSTAPDYLQLPNAADWDLATSDFTFEAWIYPTGYGSQGYGGIVSTTTHNGGATNANGVSLRFYAGTSQIWVHNANSSLSLITTNAVPLNQWSHVALVRSGTTFKVYLSGVADPTTLTYAPAIGTDGQGLVVGRAWTDYLIAHGFHGAIDEVRVSRTARYTANFTPSLALAPFAR